MKSVCRSLFTGFPLLFSLGALCQSSASSSPPQDTKPHQLPLNENQVLYPPATPGVWRLIVAAHLPSQPEDPELFQRSMKAIVNELETENFLYGDTENVHKGLNDWLDDHVGREVKVDVCWTAHRQREHFLVCPEFDDLLQDTQSSEYQEKVGRNLFRQVYPQANILIEEAPALITLDWKFSHPHDMGSVVAPSRDYPDLASMRKEISDCESHGGIVTHATWTIPKITASRPGSGNPKKDQAVVRAVTRSLAFRFNNVGLHKRGSKKNIAPPFYLLHFLPDDQTLQIYSSGDDTFYTADFLHCGEGGEAICPCYPIWDVNEGKASDYEELRVRRKNIINHSYVIPFRNVLHEMKNPSAKR